MLKLNVLKVGYIGGVVSVVFLILCTGWIFFLKTPELKDLHRQLLQMTYPGFEFTFDGLSFAFAEAFSYGFFFGVLVAGLLNKVNVIDSE